MQFTQRNARCNATGGQNRLPGAQPRLKTPGDGPGRLRPGPSPGLGVRWGGEREGVVPLPLWGSGGMTPGNFFENSDAKSCIPLIYLLWNFLLFENYGQEVGGPIHCSSQPKSWGPVFPGPYGCCAYAGYDMYSYCMSPYIRAYTRFWWLLQSASTTWVWSETGECRTTLKLYCAMRISGIAVVSSIAIPETVSLSSLQFQVSHNTSCGELLLNFHGYDKMHDAITYRANTILRDVSKITLHYINTNEHQQ